MEADKNNFSGKIKDLSDQEFNETMLALFKAVAELHYNSVVERGFYIDLEDITLTIHYYCYVEEYEKCAYLQNIINTRYKKNL